MFIGVRSGDRSRRTRVKVEATNEASPYCRDSYLTCLRSDVDPARCGLTASLILHLMATDIVAVHNLSSNADSGPVYVRK